MNNNKKSDPKQSVLSALSTFARAVTIPEIIHVANSNGKPKLSQGETEALLKKMALDGETKQLPINRFSCHHIWHGTTKPEEARCSRCGRVTTFEEVENLDKEEIYYFLQQQKDFVPDTAIAGELELGLSQIRKYLKELGDKVENDSDGNWRSILAIPVEVVEEAKNELSDDEQKELLRLERKIEKAFFVAGQALGEIRDKKLYRQGGKTFEQYCFERFSYSRPRSYQLIDAAIVYENLSTNRKQTVPSFVLPSSEYQIRSLAKLNPEEQIKIWSNAVEQNNGKIPTGKQVHKLVKEKKLEDSKRYQTQVERFKIGDVVRITAKYNSELKPYHHHWGVVHRVTEFGYQVTIYRGLIDQVLHDDLTKVKRASKQGARVLLQQMAKLLHSHGSDPDFAAYLHFIGTKPVPGASRVTIEFFSFLENS